MTSPTTTRAELTTVIKRARDIMRKDPGLNGDVDRVPQLSWLLFLKAFDDHEQSNEMLEARYQPVVDEGYRWRDWGRGTSSRTGEALTAWVNGSLLPYLSKLSGSGESSDARDVVGRVFADTRNRMLSGYLLRDLVEQIDTVNFNSSDDLHTVAHVYESMLREMRDAAGDAGEFYTPRPVVRFMVERLDPRLGESVMDPAVGTGGFLVQAQEHLMAQVSSTADQKHLVGALRGFEKKPLPYLLSQMNLLLHGAVSPRVQRGNALSSPLAEQRANGVDVLLTNPPFGGEEEASISKNFPAGRQTAETSWLFLQAVMARIERSPRGRAAVVVPNGVLFAEGIGGAIKKDLMERFDLHTVVRLPNGVFSPYTLIPTNILFFEAGRPTTTTWFWDQPVPDGRKNYTKTKPLRHEDLADLAAWWGEPGVEGRKARAEHERAWTVDAAEIAKTGYNLDLRNPQRPDDLAHRPVAELLEDLVATEEEILAGLRSLQADAKRTEWEGAGKSSAVPLGSVIHHASRSRRVDQDATYRMLGVRWYGAGPFVRETMSGSNLKAKTVYAVEEGDLIYNRLFAWKGSFGLVGPELAGSTVSNEFPTFVVDEGRTSARYVNAWLRRSEVWSVVEQQSTGSTPTSRNRFSIDNFLRLPIPLPSLAEQRRIIERLDAIDRVQEAMKRRDALAAALLPAARNEEFSRLVALAG